MNVWVIEVTYDAEVLEYISTETDSLFTAAVVSEVESGSLSLSTSGLNTGVTSSMVIGSNVAVVSLSFSVSLSAADDAAARGEPHAEGRALFTHRLLGSSHRHPDPHRRDQGRGGGRDAASKAGGNLELFRLVQGHGTLRMALRYSRKKRGRRREDRGEQ